MLAEIDLLKETPSRGTAAYPEPPRGAITEITGAASSGRTGLMHSVLAAATTKGEFCAVVDCLGTFDPLTAAQAGVHLQRVLWVRCQGHLDVAMKAADLILHSGGFGVIVLDLCETPSRDLNRIPLSYWYRFRRAVEHTPARLVVACHTALVKACAPLQLETRRENAEWRGLLFRGIHSATETRKQRMPLAG